MPHGADAGAAARTLAARRGRGRPRRPGRVGRIFFGAGRGWPASRGERHPGVPVARRSHTPQSARVFDRAHFSAFRPNLLGDLAQWVHEAGDCCHCRSRGKPGDRHGHRSDPDAAPTSAVSSVRWTLGESRGGLVWTRGTARERRLVRDRLGTAAIVGAARSLGIGQSSSWGCRLLVARCRQTNTALPPPWKDPRIPLAGTQARCPNCAWAGPAVSCSLVACFASVQPHAGRRRCPRVTAAVAYSY